MPFSAELHYFYLYLKEHIERAHRISCERADEQVLTEQILDKIVDCIKKADVIIADCSGRNPNVFYELGIAHAIGKKVILITHDDIKEVPSDVKSYEFILYNLSNHVEFFSKLDNALHNIFIKDYELLHKKAVEIFTEFNATCPSISINSKETFLSLVTSAEISVDIPTLLANDDNLRNFVLPRIVKETLNPQIMKSITNWLALQDKHTSDV
jgi:nucleoside 2-deoxyribosyltransferase